MPHSVCSPYFIADGIDRADGMPAVRIPMAALMLAVLVNEVFCCVKSGSSRPCHLPGNPVNSSSCCGEAHPPHECYGGCCLACNGPVMNPHSRCVPRNSTVSRCPSHHPTPSPLPPPPPRPCTEETLATGIRLPCPWPPVRNMTRETQIPHYIASPPAVISIDVGRQLFVDDFLISNSSSGVTRVYRQAEYNADVNPVMSPTKPWEKRNMTYARAYSGGVWWIPSEKVFKMWYGCGTSPKTDSCIGLCLATSKNGIMWDKSPPADGPVPGTNIVIDAVLKSNNVWYDLDDANASRRYKLADTGASYKLTNAGSVSSYRLWSSPDGIQWHLDVDGTGPTEDRSTIFPNPLRKPRRWTFSIKNYQETAEMFGRSRLYWDTVADDLYSAHWQENEPVQWQAAEELDPGYVAGPKLGQPAQLYNLDAYAYESIIVGYFAIFRCKANIAGCPTHPEFDSIYIGFSRDGYSWTKPPAGQPVPFSGVDLSPRTRGPFMSMAPEQQVGKDPDVASTRWNYGAVQSVTGGIILPDDMAQVSTMFTYAGGQSGYGTMGISPGCTVGVASLRRDGYAALVASSGDRENQAANQYVVTRPLAWSVSQKYLFVNIDGGMTVEVLHPGSASVVLSSVPLHTNSTRAQVQWVSGTHLPSTSTMGPFQLRFSLRPGTQFYSFWVSPDQCGASGGSVAGAGPGFNTSRDEHGTCVR